jgi:membrane-bound lytic murein transglycosylase D
MMRKPAVIWARIRSACRHPIGLLLLCSGTALGLASGLLPERQTVPGARTSALEAPEAAAAQTGAATVATGGRQAGVPGVSALPAELQFLQGVWTRLSRSGGDDDVVVQAKPADPQPAEPQIELAPAAPPAPAVPALQAPSRPAAPAPAASELFPTPPTLAKNVEFWRRIYAEVSKDHYLLHDRETMIVFAVLDLSHVPDSPRDRQKLLEAERERHEVRLRKLADRLADGATLEELPGNEQRWVEALTKLDERDPFTAASKRLRVQRGQRDQFLAGVKRSGRYMYRMLDIFQEARLPAALLYLPHVESSFNYRAISKVGASGIWQFMPATGRMYMAVNDVLDERNDPIIATRAAARHLGTNYRHLGTWPLALSAYNHGLSGIMRAVRETGTKDLGVIVQKYESPSFGFASKNFYAEFLAAKHVAENAPRYFPGALPDPPLFFDEIVLDRQLSLAAIHSRLELPTDEIVRLNPALQKDVVRGKRPVPKDYALRLPHRPGLDWVAALDGRSKPAQPAAIAAPEVLVASAETAAPATVQQALAVVASEPAAKAPAPKPPAAKPRVHTVRQGDTLGALASRYDTTVKQLVAQNKLSSAHQLKIGQRIQIPN